MRKLSQSLGASKRHRTYGEDKGNLVQRIKKYFKVVASDYMSSGELATIIVECDGNGTIIDVPVSVSINTTLYTLSTKPGLLTKGVYVGNFVFVLDKKFVTEDIKVKDVIDHDKAVLKGIDIYYQDGVELIALSDVLGDPRYTKLGHIRYTKALAAEETAVKTGVDKKYDAITGDALSDVAPKLGKTNNPNVRF